MKKRAILVLDCGATNARAVLAAEDGRILASHAVPNNTCSDPFTPGGIIWDVHEIWDKLCLSARKVIEIAGDAEIVGITVTTFGVDGAPMMKTGELLYPVISWQCSRTVPVMDSIGRYMSVDELHRITGLQPYHFNTINKLAWFRENRPDILEKMDHFVFITSVFIYFLTGEFTTDTTMAGTSMLADLETRTFSDEILERLGLSGSKFPPLCEPGTKAGILTAKAASSLGVIAGIPVFVAGHDTQFAVFFAGSRAEEPVLSSGTWEILMARTRTSKPGKTTQEAGATTELDALPGYYNMGVQWVASGALEWVSRLVYADLPDDDGRFDRMITEAEKIPAGSQGVMVIPELFPKTKQALKGILSGMTHETQRSHVYRAALEALSYYTRHGLGILSSAGGVTPDALICVGGGSKNRLWNQIRADVLGIPVKTLQTKETTVLGAAAFAFAASGIYSSPGEAVEAMKVPGETFFPGPDQSKYFEIFNQYFDWLNRIQRIST